MPDSQVMADLDGAVKWAADHGSDTTKLVITGCCWGGRITWLYASHAPAKAGVAWYGKLIGSASRLRPKNPVDVVAALQGSVLGLYGGNNSSIPLDNIDSVKRVLAGSSAAARASRFVVYPDAPHAFQADYRPSFRERDAQDGFRRCLKWFSANGIV